MSLALVAIVLAIGAGAVVAVSTREAAAAAIGLAVALVASALLADPLPSATVVGVRIVTALLAAALIRWAGRAGARQFSALGWPGEALLATAGAVGGIGVAIGLAAGGSSAGTPAPPGADGAVTTMALTMGAGTSLLVLGAAPLIHPKPGIRRAIGIVLVTQAVILIRIGMAGPPTELEEIALAALLVAAAAGGAALAHAAAELRAARSDPDREGPTAQRGDAPVPPERDQARRVAAR